MIAPVLLLFAGLLGSIWIARRSGILRHFADLARLGRRSGRALGRRHASDIWKERATRILAARMMAKSLATLGLLALIAAPVAAMLALDPIAHAGTLAAFGNLQARFALLLMGAGLAGIRYARLRLRQA